MSTHPLQAKVGAVLKRLVWRSACLFMAGILGIELYLFAQIGLWTQFNPASTAFMRAQRQQLMQDHPGQTLQHQWVDYEQISRHLKRAIIASEDANFAEHGGVEWDALFKAYEKNSKKGKIVVGGSTLTQQLAKNLFLTGERSYVRKAQEFVVTYMLEYLMDKERIFEIYLNSVEWGVGVFGAEAAARHYFNVSAANLSVAQAARLAVMLPNPRFFDAHRNSAYLAQRAGVIARRMGSAELP